MTTRPFQTDQLVGGGVAGESPLRLPEEALLVRPASAARVGILTLLGSSGRMDVERARFFAQHGAHAMALRWFGGAGQAPGICEIPLEVFVRALDRLSREPVDRLAVVGLSKGAEAALLLACVDARLDLTVAISPPSVVWANVGPGIDGRVTPYRSSWTWRGEPLPFVPYDEDWAAGRIRRPGRLPNSLRAEPGPRPHGCRGRRDPDRGGRGRPGPRGRPRRLALALRLVCPHAVPAPDGCRAPGRDASSTRGPATVRAGRASRYRSPRRNSSAAGPQRPTPSSDRPPGRPSPTVSASPDPRDVTGGP